jgi:Taurine catabolism dioxygenase TauD, TfdA family
MSGTALSTDIAWKAADLVDTGRWIYELSPAQIADIHAALEASKAAGATIETLTRDTFPLDVAAEPLQLVLRALEEDLGLFVLRGLPVERYSKNELRLIYWGLGLHLGTAVTQSAKGDVLGDVCNFGDAVSAASQTGRGYMSKEWLGFHCDTSDVVGLMVLRTSKSGGRSMFASSVAIRDTIASTRPELYDILQEPFHWSWKGQEPAGEAPYYQQPIFTTHHGRFASRYIKTHIMSAQEFPDVPRLSESQHAAMTAIDRLAMQPEYHYSMQFEPGDMQFLNNHVTYHSRTAFEDYPDKDRKRHLLRLWLAPPNSRALAPSMSAIYRDQSSGAVRGGFPSRSDRLMFETKVSEF